MANEGMIRVDAPDKDMLNKLSIPQMIDARVIRVSYKKEKERISALVFAHANGTNFNQLDSFNTGPCDQH